MLHTRLFDFNKDYELVTKWWTARNHIIVEKDFLSDYGVMVLDDHKPIIVMWLYPIMTTKWSMIRFPISNPDTTEIERDQAMEVLFHSLAGISKDMGYKYIFCTTNHPGLMNKLNKYGFSSEHTDCAHFWGGL